MSRRLWLILCNYFWLSWVLISVHWSVHSEPYILYYSFLPSRTVAERKLSLSIVLHWDFLRWQNYRGNVPTNTVPKSHYQLAVVRYWCGRPSVGACMWHAIISSIFGSLFYHFCGLGYSVSTWLRSALSKYFTAKATWCCINLRYLRISVTIWWILFVITKKSGNGNISTTYSGDKWRYKFITNIFVTFPSDAIDTSIYTYTNIYIYQSKVPHDANGSLLNGGNDRKRHGIHSFPTKVFFT